MNKDFIKMSRNILKEHKQLFLQATLETQLKKYKEEKQELEQLLNEKLKTEIIQNHILEELADCFIVAFGIGRWDTKTSDFYIKQLLLLNQEHKALGYDIKQIELRIKEKWEENKKRKWQVVNDEYKHIE